MMKNVYDNNIMITEGGEENEDFINVTFGRSLDESHEKLPPINDLVNMKNSGAENQTCINEVYNKRRSSEYYADQDNDRR